MFVATSANSCGARTWCWGALTGWGLEEDRRESKDAGFDHHLVKPMDFEALRGLLAEVP
jgi:CheY-like chemotaxis protein